MPTFTRQRMKQTLVPQRRDVRWSCCVAMLTFVVVSLPFEAVQADRASDDFNLAVGAYRSRRWELASESFAEFLKEYPDHERSNLARLYLGLSLSSREKYAEARGHLREFIRLEPAAKQSGDARYRIGECSYYLREFDSSAEELKQYLEKHPQHSLRDWGLVFLADSLFELGKAEESAALLKKFIADSPKSQVLTDAQFGLGKCLESLSRPAEAEEVFRTVAGSSDAKIAPRALAKIGKMQFQQKQYDKALATYDEVIEKYPENPLANSAFFNGGLAAYRSGQYQLAIERFEKISGASKTRLQAQLLKSMSLVQLGRNDEARKALEDGYRTAGDGKEAIEFRVQQAQLERKIGQLQEAGRIFEDIAARWPQDSRAEDAFFNAAEIRLEMKEPSAAAGLWKQLEEKFPEASRRKREQILNGRIQLASGEVASAVATLERIAGKELDCEKAARALLVGRYYLIRAVYESGQHEQVVEYTRPLLARLKLPEYRDLTGAAALASVSSLRLKAWAEARMFADEFLATGEQDEQRADVLGARSVALVRLMMPDPAIADLRELMEKHRERPQTWIAVLQVAEAADQTGATAISEEAYRMASTNESDAIVSEAGWTGLAWGLFRAKKYPEAEKAFQDLVAKFPASGNVAQSQYMQARCLEEQGDSAKAAQRYQEIFLNLTKDTPAAVAGAETSPPFQFAFDSGRQAARILGNLSQLDAADSQWELLVSRFPAAANLDRILEEWAWMNLNAERFEKSDQIYRQLLDRFPSSAFAGQARLSLAESEMQAGRMENAKKEFSSILAESSYGANEKEGAFFHLIDIYTTERDWKKVRESSDEFLRTYGDSPRSAQVRLLQAESLLNTATDKSEFESAQEQMAALKGDVVAGKVDGGEWGDRIWIVMAEAALAAGRYDAIDAIADELIMRNPRSKFIFQMRDIQGRRWKNQAPPDFVKAREYFQMAIDDEFGKGTETAARCQFLIAETYVLQNDLAEARKEYYKVYLSYEYAQLRSQSLYQFAQCELRLEKKDDAIQSLKELIMTFPDSEEAKRARTDLETLGVN
ncbi:MAG: tetratricopeptide repeat protein [Planctomyces sp.]